MFKHSLLIGLAALLTMASGALAVLIYQGEQEPSASGQYVALGSSFAAGIGLGPREPGSPLVCMRSTSGYPQQLARLTGLTLKDMTCSGSTTQHVLHGGQVFLGPQLAAIGPNAQLVTLTSGGNDVSYIGDLMFAAGRAGPLVKLLWKGPEPVEARDFKQTGENLVRIVEEVRRRAPAAKVVLVSYPAVLPPQGTCSAIGVDAAMADLARQVAGKLRDTTRAAADRSGALFVDMGAVGAEHHACARSPWVNGATAPEGAPFHPNAAGAKATAQEVFRAIAEGGHAAD